MGECRRRPRYRRLRGEQHPTVVAGRRSGALPQRQPIADHRRWRRQQRLAGTAVETRTAEAGQRTRPRHRGQPPAARHQQVEQDRTPPLLLHQPELARQTTRQLSRHRRADLEALVEPTTRGDPESPLRWTCKSVRRLAQALQAQGHEVSRTLVGHLLNEAGYSLQGNRKTTEGDSHPDRDAQFGYINTQVNTALAEQQPVISVDTKKKELVGDFRNNGREYRPQGNPEEVRVHDFLIKELGRAVPYGIYDLAANSGWVSVGVDHDTAAFAVNSIRQWWRTVGRARYPEATRLLITAKPAPAKAGGGGSNGSRVRLWKRELQKLANELGLDIMVSHLPPGTSKWIKIEHRLFSFISQNWRAKPLVSYRVIVELISATTTKTGLTVRCELDTGQYPSGVVVSDADMAAINLKRAEFHGEWHYTISPNDQPPNRALIL